MKKFHVLVFTLLFIVFLTSCNKETTEVEAPSTYYDFKVSVNCIQNIFFSKYNVDIYIDDEKKTTITHGDSSTYDFKVTEGTHTLKFTKEGTSSLKGEIIIDEIKSNIEASFKITCESDGITIKKEFIDRLIEPGDDEIKLKTNLSELYSINYNDTVKELKKMGFTNIKTLPQNDLVIGLFSNEFDVASISINGREEFFRGDIFNKDADVLIKYHTYENSSSEKSTTTYIPTTNIISSNSSYSSSIIQTTIMNTSTEAVPSTEAEKKPSIITIDNCEDLNKIFTRSSSDYDYKDFADKYRHCTLEFDGSIDYCVNHNDYKTRYDILLSAYDYSEDSQIGPTFKFENVNCYDLNLDTLFTEEEIYVGRNVHIIAKVVSFDINTGIFLLDPIEITGR